MSIALCEPSTCIALAASLLLGACGSVRPASRVAEAPWTLIVLPDTQVYAERHPEIFLAQTRWIAEHAAERNIRFVVHVGDVVEHNTAEEWELARRAFSALDGVVPYAIAPGNHDFGPGGTAKTRDTLLHEYVPPAGEPFERGRLDNTAHFFRAGGRDWMVLALEWGPRDRVVRWANDLLSRHRELTAIIVTHAYLRPEGRRADHRDPSQKWNPHQYPTAQLPGGVHDGEELWTDLVSRHPNVLMVLSGHYGEEGGAARSTETGRQGNRVHQLLSDYQLHERGGGGYLRIMSIDEGSKKITVTTYSPVTDDHLDDPANSFVLDLPAAAGPERGFSVFREVTLLSGVALSATGSGFMIYGLWKDKDPAVDAASGLLASGTVFSLGTMLTTHRYEPPPVWVFVLGPLLGFATSWVVSAAAH